MNVQVNLPKVNLPIFDAEIPSSKTKIKVRPMRAREEKILLIAKEGGDPGEILLSIKQIVNNCLLDVNSERFNTLALFDLEYLFLRIRSISIGNKIKLTFQDTEDGKSREFEINLDDVKVVFPDKDYSKIIVDDNISLILKYPNISLYDDKAFLNLSGEKALEELAIRCLSKIHNGTGVIDAKFLPNEKRAEWLNELPIEAYNQIRDFFIHLPIMKYEIDYVNDNGNQRKITLSTLNDFFMLR